MRQLMHVIKWTITIFLNLEKQMLEINVEFWNETNTKVNISGTWHD